MKRWIQKGTSFSVKRYLSDECFYSLLLDFAFYRQLVYICYWMSIMRVISQEFKQMLKDSDVFRF